MSGALLHACSCEQEFELFTDERSVGAILGFVRKQMAFSCRSSLAVVTREPTAAGRRGALACLLVFGAVRLKP